MHTAFANTGRVIQLSVVCVECDYLPPLPSTVCVLTLCFWPWRGRTISCVSSACSSSLTSRKLSPVLALRLLSGKSDGLEVRTPNTGVNLCFCLFNLLSNTISCITKVIRWFDYLIVSLTQCNVNEKVHCFTFVLQYARRRCRESEPGA